jgi:hypothetical protein
MRFKLSAALLFMLCTSAHATSIKDVVNAAFDSEDGHASMELNDAGLTNLRKSLPIEGPIIGDAKIIKRFNQQGCARFHIALIATLNKESGAQGKLAPIPGMEMNMCKDGSYPKEGVDPNAPEKLRQQIVEMNRQQDAMIKAAKQQK